MSNVRELSPSVGSLPIPDSEELLALLGSEIQRMMYGLLYRRRENPPTMVELRAFAFDAFGEDHSQTDRRVRELRRYFDVQVVGVGRQSRYLLKGWSPTRLDGEQGSISQRRRAQVLAPGRCFQCGRTPAQHGVVLVVDHKIPQAWGGTNDVENLQPLCEECNAGKRYYYQTMDPYAEQIRAAANHDEPQRRIGELLKAFGREWVPSDVLGIVASAKEYQEDWQRRLRDLRFLGWDYEWRKDYTQPSRVATLYRLKQSAPWPENIREAITAEENRRKQEKAQARLDLNQPAVAVQVAEGLRPSRRPGRS